MDGQQQTREGFPFAVLCLTGQQRMNRIPDRDRVLPACRNSGSAGFGCVILEAVEEDRSGGGSQVVKCRRSGSSGAFLPVPASSRAFFSRYLGTYLGTRNEMVGSPRRSQSYVMGMMGWGREWWLHCFQPRFLLPPAVRQTLFCSKHRDRAVGIVRRIPLEDRGGRRR